MKIRQTILAALAAALLLVHCKKEEEKIAPPADDRFEKHVEPKLKIGKTPLDYSVSMPTHLKSVAASQSNPKKAQLGRVIFYDKNLSLDGTVACANCHRSDAGFSDPRSRSTGVFNGMTTRNSMSLVATPWFGGVLKIDSLGNSYNPLFWDHRAHSVAEQSKGAFTSPVEMGLTMPEVVAKIQNEKFYNWLFEQAFGDTTITEERIFIGLSHFLSAFSAANSKFDQAMAAAGATDPNQNLPQLTAEENEGKEIYMKNCHSCHGSLVSGQLIIEANNGLENPYVDKGKGLISGLFYENGIFRVPGLRNIGLTAPFMHDGRFETLDEVIEHYNSGVVKVFGLHGDLLEQIGSSSQYQTKKLNLSASQKAALKAFLETLTDATAATDERFANPFR